MMYRVEWAIDVAADNPRAAAEEAFQMMRKPDTTATVFDVFDMDGNGEFKRVDLQEPADDCL